LVGRVLVVGGAGYVGGWLSDSLSLQGHEVTVYDLLLYEDIYLKPVEFVHGDVLDHAQLEPLLEQADAVIWLAALVGDAACGLDPGLTTRINVESVRHLARRFKKRIVFMSTCSVYGAQDGELDETSPVQPLSLYAQTKLDAERVLTEEGADAVVFRLGTLHGVSDTYSRLRTDLVVNALTIRAALHARMSVFGGRQYRPLLHVRDVATAVAAAVEARTNGIFNLHAENLTILEIAERIRSFAPDADLEITEMRYEDLRNYRVSSKRVHDVLGFEPTYCVDDGIRQVLDLVQQGRIRDLSTSRFSNVEALRPYLQTESSPLGDEIHVSHPLARHRTP